jgi:TetR/AcrR family transcriptional repressor of nem operon
MEAWMTITPTVQRSTRTQVLDLAERLVQTRGFNAFSYADIATELSMTTAAVHYHFKGKTALGEALLERYTDRFLVELDRISAVTSDARQRVELYVDLYRGVLAAGRMCLCGMLAAESETLPESMRAAIERFFDRNEAWLMAVVEAGAAAHVLTRSEPARDTARMILDTLEGAVMIARATHDPDRFEDVAARLLRTLE